jgi:predicted nucleic acid-binding protein
VSETIRRELAMTRYDDLRAKWFALIDGSTVIVETDAILDLADDLFDRFVHHDDALEAADALIAAAALVTGRTLITENWRDFHFIDDLPFVDIRRIATGDLPVLASRSVQTGGPVAGAGCCRKLIRSRAAT